MPNHVTNRITGPKAIVDALIRKPNAEEKAEHDKFEKMVQESLKRQGREEEYAYTPLKSHIIDFSLVVPQPDNIETGDCNGKHEEDEVCWYDWNVKNWGTKWNGYESQVEELTDDTVRITFDTAWSHPEPVIVALSKKFPDEVLEVEYADEDLGHNLGHYSIVDGMSAEEEIGSEKEKLDFAAELKFALTYDELLAEFED